MKGVLLASSCSAVLASTRHGATFLQPEPVHLVGKQNSKDPYWVENTIPSTGTNDRDYIKDQNPVNSEKHLYTNPNWDKKHIQGANKYANDYVSDERPTEMYAEKKTATSSSEASSKKISARAFDDDPQPKCRIGHSADWYKKQCKDINGQCQDKLDAARSQYERDLSALEAEYRRQKRILENKEAHHEDEKQDVADQKREVRKQKMEVKDAKVAVRENAHCPPDLAEARKRLAELEAVPNETPEDIEMECAARKKVLRLEECVEILREAEEVLYDEKEDYAGEKSELGEDKREAATAADALPPQEQRVADALAAWEAAKRNGPPSSGSVWATCEAQIDALKRAAEDDVKDAEAEYRRQKNILGGKKDDHAGEQEDVTEQEDDVAEEKRNVETAKAKVAESDHCPADLDAAESKLAALEAKPNRTPEDIEEECRLKKEILKLQKCVEELRAAEAVLSKKRIDYSDEKADLSEEQSEEAEAASAVPPQQKKVDCAKEALDAARAALDAIRACSSGASKKEEPKSEPAPEPAEGGAARLASGSGVLVLVFAMLCAFTSA
eukprot:TRINITY_DN2263_c0_g1_i1.p1 TRINITY_DN2263_c0_g1~~TRINITY_DN2263_c0_g1_i1.p1  ORF type:complete len:557 (-),score=211.32 TRINITY_DN2263_c0_g1_i1:139-1809(-)